MTRAPSRFPRLLLALCLVLPTLASAQPAGDPDTWRLPGTRNRDARADATYYGPEEIQPRIGRAPGHRTLSTSEAGATLAELRADLAEPRSLESLKPGLEDYRAVMGRLDAAVAASKGGLRLETIGTVYGLPVKAVHLTQPGSSARPRMLILGGVHSGTEKAGFEAATRLVEEVARDAKLRARYDVTIVPLVNPTALVLGERLNAKGVDINRTFTESKAQPESRVLMNWARKQRAFDVSIDLHTAGDKGRDGFFLIRAQKDKGLGARMMHELPVDALLDAKGKPGEARVGPYILYGSGLAEIESIKHTTMDLMRENGTRLAYTFEAPTRANTKVQVDLTMRFLHSALRNSLQHVRPRAGVPGRLEALRRGDGTLKWREVVRQRALPEIGGLAHFGLALFLKEVAVVASTGDRARIEEFFDGLLTTDFYKHYGLFVAGARLGEVAYARTLQRYVKPGFVNGLLKTNLVLAAGIALPQIVDGTFEGRSFAISLGSLGISSAAVRAGVRSITWVADLKSVRNRTGLLRRAGLGRIGRIGGWVYTAAELAVVLYVAEAIEERVDARLALAAARDEVADAGRRLIDAAASPRASAASVQPAIDAYRQAWGDYRNHLYAPLHLDEARLAVRLEALSREAKLLADRRLATLKSVGERESLRRNVVARHGSLEAYAESLVKRDEEALGAKVDVALASYDRSRSEHLAEVYQAHRRKGSLLSGAPHLDWLLAGGREGAAGDPYGARSDAFARWGRRSARSDLDKALRGASRNRLQAYDDERELLDALARAHGGRLALSRALTLASEKSAAVKAADERLIATLRAPAASRGDEAAKTGLDEALQPR